MVNPQIVDYIKENLSKGFSLDQIKEGLVKASYPESDINEAINSAQQGKEEPVKKGIVPKKSKKKVIISLAINIVLGIIFVSYFLISGGINKETGSTLIDDGTKKVEEFITSNDCGEDFDCFIMAAEDCNEAKMLYVVPHEITGTIFTFASVLEIRGLESGKCVYNDWYKDFTTEFNEAKVQELLNSGLTLEEIDQQEQIEKILYQSMIGTGRNCKLNDTIELVSALKIIKQREVLTSAWDPGNCEKIFVG